MVAARPLSRQVWPLLTLFTAGEYSVHYTRIPLRQCRVMWRPPPATAEGLAPERGVNAVADAMDRAGAWFSDTHAGCQLDALQATADFAQLYPPDVPVCCCCC